MNDDIQIYISTHKKYDEILNNDIYTPVLGGAEINKIDCEYLLDNSGDNISYKNLYYNEYTVLYWSWKNLNSDIVGLYHYRRYFLNGIFGQKLDKNEILEYLNENDIIVGKGVHFKEGSLRKYFINDKKLNVTYENLPHLERIIKKQFPKYLTAFNEYLDNNTFYPFSMFITTKELADQYCEFIFPILEELEKTIGLTPYNNHPMNQRVFAILGEFLLGVWINGSNLKVKECYVYRMEAISTLLCILDDNFLNKNLTYLSRLPIIDKIHLKIRDRK